MTSIALVGDRSPSVQSHASLPHILASFDDDELQPLDVCWLASVDVASTDLGDFDGIWVVPGSPYADTDGVLMAIRFARERGVPILGTCGGFQHMLLEFARTVCGLRAEHAEESPGAVDPVIEQLSCSLVGQARQVTAVEATRAAALVGTAPRTERYHCSYGLNPQFVGTLQSAGLVLSGFDEDGNLRLVELVDHPFYLGSLFQPELSSSRSVMHPLIAGFIAAARGQASPCVSPGAELPGAMSSPR
jgi:CTP synthase (UTP-ammonia lyase)